MRLAWPPPWHLIASALIPLAALALVNLPATSQMGSLSLLALIAVLLNAGHLVMLFAFPGNQDLSLLRRALLSLITSVLLAGLISLILMQTPRGLQPASLATTISLLAIFLTAVAYGRWSDLSRKKRFLFLPRRGARFGGYLPRSWAGITARRAALAVILLAAIFAAAYAFVFGLNQISLGEGSTEFEVSWPSEADFPSSSLPAGSELFAQARITNHENGPANYTLRLMLQNSALFSKDLFLDREESWQDRISFVLADPSPSEGPERLDLLLYKDGDLLTPYKEKSLLVNISQNDSRKSSSNSLNATTDINGTDINGTDINETDNISPVIFEETSEVAVLSTGGSGSGGGGSGGGGMGTSRARSSAPAAKPSAQEAKEEEKKQPEEAASSPPTAADTTSVKEQSNASLPETIAVNSSIRSGKENLTGKDNQTPVSLNLDNLTQDILTQDNLTLQENLTDPATSQEQKPAPEPENSSGETSSLLKVAPSLPALAPQETTPPDTSPLPETSPQPYAPALPEANITQEALNESNRPPALKALTPDKASPQTQGVSIFWRAEAEDEEGDKILYRFLLDGKEAKKWSKAGSWSWMTAGLPAGDYRISVLARDGKHASEDSFDSIMNASFTISRINQAPALQELKSDKSGPQSTGSMITWTADASDPDNDTIYFKFMKNDEDMTGWLPSNSWTWNTSSEKPGDYRIAVLAEDGLHASKDSFDSTMESKISLTASNSAPRLTELKADPSGLQAAQDTVITWTAIAVDPDGDAISYKFLANDSEAGGWSSSNVWVWDTSSAVPGEYNIKVLARDGKHASEDSFDSSMEANLAITASNQPPALISLKPDKSSPQVQGATVSWTAEARDPEGDKILYKFQLNGRDMGRWSESAVWKWSSRDLAAGDYRIRVLARDGRHASEDSFDSSKDMAFSLITEIDQQIDELMKKGRSDG
jgi:uncharacterized membrane protein